MKFRFKDSLFLILALLFIIGILMIALDAGPHMTLISCLVISGLSGHFYHKMPWSDLESYMISGVTQCMKAVFILGLIGALISAWMSSGTIPTIFYYGMHILSPEWFLVTTLFVSILVSTFTGSSLTTAGTVGVALMGISDGFGISAPLTAGAVICGACFGDKLSPLSDTTNFASGIVNVELFTHIKHLLWTTIPALLLTVLAFILIGEQQGQLQTELTNTAINALNINFNISVFTLISPVVVMVMAFRRLPTLPVLITGILTALLTTLFIQEDYNLSGWFQVLTNGYTLSSGSEIVDKIVNRGGIMSMMFSVSLVIIALAFGGLLQGMGVIDSLMNGLKSRLKSRGHIILSATLSSIGINFLTGEQYLSILLPGQAFKSLFQKNKIEPETLSRTMEDAGTLINPLVPWGVCGAFFSATLGVSVGEYAPFTFFLYLSPMFTILLGYIQKNKVTTEK